MAYQPDLIGNKPLKNTYARHEDSYSVDDLRGEVVLVTALISDLLRNCELSDPYVKREILALIEVKRRLLSTRASIVSAEFKGQILLRQTQFKEDIVNSVTPEKLKLYIQNLSQILGELLPAEKLEDAISKLLNVIEN
jgi:hypothetical protein